MALRTHHGYDGLSDGESVPSLAMESSQNSPPPKKAFTFEEDNNDGSSNNSEAVPISMISS